MKKLKLSKRKPEDMLYHNMDKMYIKQDKVLIHLHTGNYFEAQVKGYVLGLKVRNTNSTLSTPPLTLEDLQDLRKLIRKAIKDIKAETKRELWDV